MRRIIVGLIMAVMLAFGGMLPSYVMASSSTTIRLATHTSFIERSAVTFNGRPLMYCQTRYESIRRFYAVCQALEAIPRYNLEAGQVTETIQYDNMYYQRTSTTTWSARALPEYTPYTSFNENRFKVHVSAAVTNLGPATINGVPTTHYQYWIQDANVNAYSDQKNPVEHGQAVYDIFVSSDGLVIADQFSSRGTHPDFGAGELAFVSGYSEHNTSIQVSPPPADEIQR